MDELPYQVEYAKSGRAGCKGCKQKIDQGVLRIARMVQSAFHDGKQPNWYHEECFFQKQRPQSAGEIGKLNTLKFNDQKRITAAIESSSSIAMPVAKSKGKGKKRANGDSNAAALRDFKVEYSKSSRATCCVCEIKICKDEVRCAKVVFDTEVGSKFGGQPLWHHVKCFAEARSRLLYFAGGEDLNGFNSLSKEDKAMVKREIKPLKTAEVPIKKLKAEPQDDEDKKAEKEFEKTLEKQSKLYYKYREAVGNKNLTKHQLELLLEENNQEVPSTGGDELISRVADMMAFGALEPCAVCKHGQLVLDTYGYTCTGNVNEWVSCTNSVAEPKRVAMKVPSSLKKNAAFAKYKPKVGVRAFKQPPLNYIVKKEEFVKQENGATGASSLSLEEAVSRSTLNPMAAEFVPRVKQERPAPPLKNLQFFLYGKLSDKEAVKHRVLKLGGLVVSKLVDTTVAVISTKRDVERMPSRMLQIQEKDIEVVEESFLDLIDAKNGTIAKSLELIKEHNIAEWGSDPAKRLPQDVLDGKSIPKSGSLYVKSGKSGVKKLKVKEGTTVDPDSGLEDVAHVYKDAAGTRYTVVLNQTDVQKKRNAYYKLQILQADTGNKYWLFRSWGRIGTTIGGTKLEECSTLNKAIALFEEYYLEKSKNDWEDRDHFVKHPDGYYPVDVDYSDECATVALQPDAACSLAMPVQKLVMQIFDINVMKKTLLQFELDTEKMPLGKLSKKQIKAGYTVLSDLLRHLKNGQAAHHHVIAATNRFYTLIPHDFGIYNPPLLDSEDAIKKKTEMLDNMLEIEIAYSLLSHDDTSTVSPIEAHYLKLRTRLEPLEARSPEFEMLAQYVRNTHAATHSQYTLEIAQVFKVVRDGEDKRYKPFRKLHNRRLLWHGSRVTNFAGILSQGLRIAPPEAPATGYMFGKGIYFADMVSKSANYCAATPQAPDGVMLLCEVACGDMHECTQAQYVTQLPAGKHSTYGMGQTMPDPDKNLVLEDGLIVPCGAPVQRSVRTSLLYNEYIVYDVAQVNVKYLFQMKFNFKYGH